MQSFLQTIGLEEKERAVFNALYTLGSATPADIADATPYPRSTIYNIAQELVDKGLIREDPHSKTKLYVALHPDELLGIIPQLEKDLKTKKEALCHLVEHLNKEIQTAGTHIPKVTYLHEEQIEDFLYKRAPIWNKSMKATNTEYVGFQDYTSGVLFADWIRWYWKQPSTYGIRLRLLSNVNAFEKNVLTPEHSSNRTVRFWEGLGEISASTWIHGDYTFILQTREHPYFAIEIYDAFFAKTQRQIFEMVWRQAFAKDV